LIVLRIDTHHNFIIVTPEKPDDLWALRRVISKGDLVASESSRVYKETAEYARPDKERVKVNITLGVEEVKLDSTLSRLRISGKILEVSNDMLSKNEFHSFSISEGHRLSIKKPDGFTPLELKLIKGSGSEKDSYVIVALDGREAGVGVVNGTHLKILPTIESGATGKMYHDSKRTPSNYFEKIADVIATVYPKGAPIFSLGPGNTKNSFANFLSQNRKEFANSKSLEGSDVAGEDGVYMALRNKNLQDAVGETKLAKATKLISEVMRRISLGDSRVALAFKDNFAAAQAGALESVLISDKIFAQKDVEEDDLVKLLNTVEEYKGETFLLDSSTDLGAQVGTLGGVVGLLRFVIHS
jgi:protein pelota